MAFVNIILALLLVMTGVVRSQERQPVSIALDSEAEHVYVANRDSGSITIVDLKARSIVSERKVGQQLSCVASVPGSTRFLATDQQANELLLVDAERMLTRVPVAASPVKVVVSRDGRQAVVASLWSRSLSFVTIDGMWLEVNKVIPLGFSPRELCLLGQDRIVVVADAFGGHIAVFSTTDTNLRVSQRIPGHNIGGLVAHADQGLLAISHQRLRAVANTSIGDIHWGNLLGNHLRFLNLKDVHVTSRSLMRDGWLDDLGGPSNGAGDPGAMVVTPSGYLVTCLSGAHAVEIIHPNVADSVRVPVGRGPVAISVIPETNLAVVANRFSDSLTLLDVPAAKVMDTISLSDDTPLPTRSQQGEALFHDATLSLDGWMSCHSCHTDGHSSGELADTLSDGHYTTPKRILSLRGVHGTEPLGWRGNVESLEQQIHSSVAKTMRGRRALSDEETLNLATYLRSLPPIADSENLETREGSEVFQRLDCVSCHRPPLYTTPKAYDVGLEDERGEKLFNPPSLRGVRHRDGLFHDKSAASIEEVVLKRQHQVPPGVDKRDLNALVAFLRSL